MKRIATLLAVFMLSTLAFGQCYPTYANDCGSGDYIDGFTFNTINNVGTACGTPGPSNFTDYTALSTSVSQGITYPVTCSPGPTWDQYFVVFIDFNNDLDFDDANEFFDIGFGTAGGSVTANITIPNGLPGGSHLMRVVCQFGNNPILSTESCGNFTWGEVEDYTLIVSPPVADDAATVSIDAPGDGCGLSATETVTATFLNAGTNTINDMTVSYRVNGGAWISENLIGLGIANLATYQHNFATTADLSVPGTYTFDVATNIVGDGFPANDTIFGITVESIPLLGSLPYFEDFESGAGGWLASGTGANWTHGVVNKTNIFGNGGCVSGDSLVFATGLTGDYNNDALEYLTSPCLDFSSATSDPTLTFDQLIRTESCCDELFVEMSFDGGITWNTVGTNTSGYNWYNNGFNNWWSGATSANPGEWTKSGHVLTGSAGQSSVRIRFVFSSDGSVTDEGAAIDNINIDQSVSLSDGLPTGLIAPVSSCGLSNAETIIATFGNNGADSLIGFDVCYILDNGAPMCETVNDTIAPGETYTHTFASTIDLSSVAAYGLDVYIVAPSPDTCAVSSNDTLSFVVQNKPIISSFPYLETFDNGPGGWDANNGANGTWELATPAGAVINSAYSGTNSWITNADGDYNVNDQSAVESPCFDFTSLDSGSWVAMGVWWDSENSWDGANLQISIDTGATWLNVGNFGAPDNWYNDNSINGTPGGSQEGWTGTTFNNGSNEWVIAKHPLDDSLVGVPYALFRVNFGSDGSVTNEGFAFDNFAIGVPPTIDLGPDYIGCGNYELNPGLPGSYEWFTEDTATFTSTLWSTDPIGVFPNTSPAYNDTTYNAIVVYTDTLGLCAMDTVQLTMSPAPWNPLNDTTICYDDTVVYSVPFDTRYTYLWSNGSTADTAEYVYTAGGIVQVTVIDTVSGCSNDTSAMIFQTPAITLADVAVCDGDTAFLDAGSMYDTFAWGTGDTTQVIGVTVAANYSVTVTDTLGCVSSDDADVTINPLPNPSIFGASDTLCDYNDITLDGGAGFSGWDWSTGGTSQMETIAGSSLPAGANTITLTVTDGNGCMAMDSVSIFVDACASLEELAVEFTLFPNPAEGVFNYAFDGNVEALSLELTDVLGKSIWTRNAELQGQIDITDYPRGTYLLRIFNGENAHVIRLVKQ